MTIHPIPAILATAAAAPRPHGRLRVDSKTYLVAYRVARGARKLYGSIEIREEFPDD